MRRVYSVTNNKPMRRRTKISAEKVVAVINQFQRCVVFLNFVSWRKYGGLLLVDSSPSLMEYETWMRCQATEILFLGPLSPNSSLFYRVFFRSHRVSSQPLVSDHQIPIELFEYERFLSHSKAMIAPFDVREVLVEDYN
ncbi:hypothetical protein HZH68_008059 [Vespula germanica]|uniref:Uncharacterized protein n=1 Tax=Vespula germanica TaxID=30212 RepID=A0A834N7V6_VESGE|nr:hypothetical protein HZH68_008059 [Vespula germanica]